MEEIIVKKIDATKYYKMQVQEALYYLQDGLVGLKEESDEIKESADKIASICENSVSNSEILLKLDLINERLDRLEKAVDNSSDSDMIMQMLEKINSKLGLLMEENQNKISDIRTEVDKFKEDFTTVTGGEDVQSNDDLKESFDSLSSELNSLSELINENDNSEELPDSIKTAFEEIGEIPEN